MNLAAGGVSALVPLAFATIVGLFGLFNPEFDGWLRQFCQYALFGLGAVAVLAVIEIVLGFAIYTFAQNGNNSH